MRVTQNLIFKNKEIGKNWGNIFRLGFLLALILINAPAALAQSINPTQLLSDLQTDTITIDQAAAQIQQNSNLTLPQAQSLVQSVTGNSLVDIGTGSEIINGFLGSNSPLQPENLAQINNIIETLQNTDALTSRAQDLLQEVARGAIPPEIGEALSNIDLGQIANIADLVESLNINGVLDQLNELLDINPAQVVADLLGDITGLALDPSALLNSTATEIAEALAGQLQNIAPGLLSAIEGVLGDGAVAQIIAGLLGGGNSSSGPSTELCTPICSSEPSCGRCAPEIQQNHIEIRTHVSNEFESHRNWIVNDYFLNHIQKAMALMTNQLSNTGMQQMQIIGSFFDAKHQLESQRLFQALTAEAHKDYHPSEALCSLGTNTRHFANSKRRSDMGQIALAKRLMQRQMNEQDGLSADNHFSDMRSRIDDFIEKFCDNRSGGQDEEGVIALEILCTGSPEAEQINADVNYTTTIENKLTLEADFTTAGAADHTNDEENIFALSANLFAHDTMPDVSEELLGYGDGRPKDKAMYYLDLRSMAAKRSIAQNSFAAITAMRTEGAEESGPFLKAILAETGINDAEIEEYLGENPSHFAQEEVMMKLLYQDPTFYINLYDKPANIERINASMLALELIQDRNIYESLLRSEATLATLVETLLLKEHRRIAGKIDGLDINDRRRNW